MRRLALLASVALACAFLIPLPVVSQWARVELDCVRDTGETFPTGYESKSYATAVCNALNRFEEWGKAHAFSFGIVTSSNGEKRSEAWDGSYVEDMDDCPAMFTDCGAFDTAGVQFLELAVDSVRLTRESGSEYAAAWVDVADETDARIQSCIAHSAGVSSLYASAIVSFVETGTSYENNHRAEVVWFPADGTVYSSTATGGTRANVVQGTTDATPCFRAEHDASADQTSLQQSTDAGMTWAEIQPPLVRDFGAAKMMLLVSSNIDANVSTFDFSDIVADNALQGGDPPPDPDDPPAQFITNQTGGPPWPSGTWISSSGSAGVTQYNAWKTYTGYEPDVVTIVSSYNPSTWTSLAGGLISHHAALIDAIPTTTALHIIFPPIPSESGATNRYCSRPQTWTDINNGTHDARYTAAANAWKSLLEGVGRDASNTIIRLGHEMDGGWYQWSICGVEPAVFKSAWSRIVGLMRAVIPNLKFDFSVARHYVCYTWPVAGSQDPYVFEYDMAGHSGGCPLDEITPPAADWNVITVGLHSQAPDIVDEVSFSRHDYAPFSQQFGLKAACDIAKANDRHCGSTEWGPYIVSSQSCPAVAADPDFMVRRIYQFMWDEQDWIGIDSHFTYSCTFLYGANAGTPAGLAYAELWPSGAAP